METRAARRKAAAAAKRTKERSRKAPAVDSSSRAIRAPIGQQTANIQSPSQTVELEALVLTHTFDSGDDGEPYSATVRLTGQREGVEGARTPQDTFVQEDQVGRVVPGAGPVAITSWVYGLDPGEWTVNAELWKSDPDGRHVTRLPNESIHPASWSWRRWAPSVMPSAPVATRWAQLAPLARVPAVLPGIFALLVVLGGIASLLMLTTILPHENVVVGRALVVFPVALIAGMTGAKLWYAVLHPGPWKQAILGGWAVDGFLLVAPLAAVLSLLALNLPVGPFLDAAVPGVFFGVAIGRVGCFLTGCCAGRVSNSRWSVWSSDRRIGARRIPAQLLESAAGLLIGITAAVLILTHVPRPDGLIFLGAFVTYGLLRQGLLRVRAERREFSWRRRAVPVGM